MAQVTTKDFSTLPVGRLGLIPLQSCSSLGAKVNDWLVKWRAERQYPGMDSFAFEGYKRDSYIIDAKTPRFGSGEGKCTINESVRGDDIYVMVDVTNYSLSYPIGPYTNLMSPDDHFQDMKRVIAAVGGKARRVNVIMPYLYESRQDKRVGRESLDCANALHELIDMGVENIITFDAHDSRVQNATPLHGFETVQPSYQFIKALLKNEEGLHIDKDHFMTISPDEGSMSRAIYLANVLGVDMGMYYKRLDYSRYVNGRQSFLKNKLPSYYLCVNSCAKSFFCGNYSSPRALLIASRVSSITSSVCAVERNIASNWDGARWMPRFSIPLKYFAKRSRLEVFAET